MMTFELLAQIPEPTSKDMLSILGPAGIAACLAWYLWYTTSVSNPKAQADARSERETATQQFTATLDRIVDKFQGELSQERQHREREAEQTRNHIAQHVGELRQSVTESGRVLAKVYNIMTANEAWDEDIKKKDE